MRGLIPRILLCDLFIKIFGEIHPKTKIADLLEFFNMKKFVPGFAGFVLIYTIKSPAPDFCTGKGIPVLMH